MAASVSVTHCGSGGQEQLLQFRDQLYGCFTARSDALFELVDALCSPVPVAGVAHLSLAACARRGHGSGYAALRHGRIDIDRMRDLLAAYRPSGWVDFAVDTTTWPRPDAACSPGRGYYHHAHAKARQVNGQPVVPGWNMSLVAALSPASPSWTAPLDMHWRTVGDNVNTIAVAQITALLPRLDTLGNQGLAPLFVFDAGYNPAALTVALAGTGAQIAVRIRNDRSFYTRAQPPPPRAGRGKPGRPPRHGTPFYCKHPASWPTPDDLYHTDTGPYGHIDVQAWHQLHPERPGIRDPSGRPAIIECTLIRIHVGRLPTTGKPATLWLWWAGDPPSTPDLARVVSAYLHRFDIEHTIRFAKQVLGWTTPKIRTPPQAHLWTWLITAAYTQLHLARHLVADHRLPWQPPLPPHKMTPGRVRAGFGHLLPMIGTPTNQRKPCRAGPGRPPGRTGTPAPRHPPIRTEKVKPPKKVKPR